MNDKSLIQITFIPFLQTPLVLKNSLRPLRAKTQARLSYTFFLLKAIWPPCNFPPLGSAEGACLNIAERCSTSCSYFFFRSWNILDSYSSSFSSFMSLRRGNDFFAVDFLASVFVMGFLPRRGEKGSSSATVFKLGSPPWKMTGNVKIQ